MKTYLLGIWQPVGPVPPPEVLEPAMRKLGEITRTWEQDGSLVFTGGLFPPEASTVVRHSEGDPLITDGPLTEGKEFLGGMFIVRAPDLDVALKYARQVSDATTLAVEVRPFQS